MPQPTPEQIHATVMEWLEQRGGTTPCPSCGRNEFDAGDLLVSAPLFTGGTTVTGSGLPLAFVVCKNCAHTMFYNAKLMDLV